MLTIGKQKIQNNNVDLKHYFDVLGLKSEPFSTSPDPYFFFPSRQHRRILSSLEISIRLRRGANLIVGDIGTGKTTLCRTLLQSLKYDSLIEVYLLLNPNFDSEMDFLKSLASFFYISNNYDSSFKLASEIKNYLYLKGVEENKTIVLIIDEAQKLSFDALECLRSFLNYETNEYKLLQLILFSQLQIKEKLKDMPNFVDRLNYKIELHPLSLLECAELIHYRLTKSGFLKNIGAIFKPSAINAIHKISKGFPRKICMIAHKALEHMIMLGKLKADENLINNIIADEINLL